MHRNRMQKSGRHLKTSLLTALAVGYMALVAASPARAAVLSFGNFPGGVFGGKGCADVQGGSLANNTPVNAYNCTAAPNQQFEFSAFTVYALGGQTCLDVASPESNPGPGTPVDSYTCNGGINQIWAYYDGLIINPTSDLCLDATIGTNGTQLVVNTCDIISPSQQWQIKDAVLSFGDFPGGVFGGENCADVQGGSLANSTPVNAYNCTAAPNQQFEFSGFTIYAMGGQTCLDIASPNGSWAAGDLVDSYPCTGGLNQQWTYNNAFGNINTATVPILCLDATTGANSTQLMVNYCKFPTPPGQQWQIK